MIVCVCGCVCVEYCVLVVHIGCAGDMLCVCVVWFSVLLFFFVCLDVVVFFCILEALFGCVWCVCVVGVLYHFACLVACLCLFEVWGCVLVCLV